MPANVQIKERLRQGKAVTVVGGHQSSDMIDFLGQFGLDGVWIECEHGPVSWEQIGDLSRACDLWNLASIVRVPTNEPWVITRTLDRGASGIVVPHVSTKAEAEQVVQSAKFGPIGRRGMFGSRRSYGVSNYFQKANDETTVVILIEEMEAIQNLAAILTVDHIDGFFVAPSDLAQTMGYVGQPNHPEVRAVIDDAIRQIVAAGRTAGALVTDENVDHYHELGARFFLTQWTNWVASGARNFRAHLETK
ncbi:MAG TPA: aldolase/citrate lyase family protein [Chloroflexota bacterium]|nr:aldolase/citrate lyase family protein [Chloroflexota bacterium]